MQPEPHSARCRGWCGGRTAAEPFAHLLDEDLFARLEREMNDPASLQGRGSKENFLVEVMGLEPNDFSAIACVSNRY
jgi:hypothetical protein